jgi:hypothetical protein
MRFDEFGPPYGKAFCVRTMLGQIMTMGIRRRAWTRGFAVSLIVAIVLVVICLILLALLSG